MKILSGFIRKTGGDILADGRHVDFRTPAEAAALGIGMLYQDPLDFPNLAVLDNFMLGQLKGPGLNPAAHLQRLRQLADHFNFSLNPADPVSRLTVGERQQLELLRLLATGRIRPYSGRADYRYIRASERDPFQCPASSGAGGQKHRAGFP